MKIAHIQLLPLLSGVQRVSLQEFKENLDTFEYSLICKESGDLTSVASEYKVNNILINSLTRNISPINDLISLFKLFYIFKKNKFDAVHTHSSKTGVLGRIAAKFAGVPKVIHTVHGFGFFASNSRLIRWLFIQLERIAAYCSDTIICLHEDDKKIACEVLKISPEKIVVIPNGIDVEHFRPRYDSLIRSTYQSELSLSPDNLVFTMIGRLWEQKNPLLFIKAAIKYNQNTNQPAYFLVVGDGELKADLEELITESGQSKYIKLLGWRHDVVELLNVSDFFVLPSLWEGMPLAILEALSCGLPCLVSNINGNRHLIDHGVDGFIFDLTVEHLVDTLILAANSNYAFMSENARKKVLLNYDLSNRIKTINKIYQ